jgi:hypothetical protein
VLNDTTSIIILGVLLFVMLLVSMGVQAWRTRRSPMGRVVGIASDLRYNRKLCEKISGGGPVARFKTGNWDKNRERIEFIPGEVRDELAKLYETIGEVNATIDASQMHGSKSYMGSISIDKMLEMIMPLQEQIQNWVYENMNNPEYLPKKRGFLRR